MEPEFYLLHYRDPSLQDKNVYHDYYENNPKTNK